MNPADNRVRITKMMIRNALLQLLKEKTLQTITVRELCQVADINRGTFYTHYRRFYERKNIICIFQNVVLCG